MAPRRASVSRTEAADMSEWGPPSWKEASVSVKLTQQNAGRCQSTPRWRPYRMPANWSMAVWSVREDQR